MVMIHVLYEVLVPLSIAFFVSFFLSSSYASLCSTFPHLRLSLTRRAWLTCEILERMHEKEGYICMTNWRSSVVAPLNNDVYWATSSLQLYLYHYEHVLIYWSHKRIERERHIVKVTTKKVIQRREEKRREVKWSVAANNRYICLFYFMQI